MLQSLRPLIARYQELSLRERVMLGVATVAVGYFSVDMLLVTPQLERQKKQAVQERAQEAEHTAMVAILSARSTTAKDVLGTAQSERDALQATVSEGERLVDAARRNTDVAPLLRSMAQASPNLRLTALRSAPTAPFYQAPVPPPAPARPASAADQSRPPAAAASAAASAAPAVTLPALHVKAVEATVQGNYLDLLSYLRRLREHTHPLFWDSAIVTVGTYPDASLRVVLNLLTTQPDHPKASPR